MIVALVFAGVFACWLDGNKLLVRGTERLEIAVAAMKTGLRGEISGANLVCHSSNRLFRFRQGL
jgi:hypothetical protein